MVERYFIFISTGCGYGWPFTENAPPNIGGLRGQLTQGLDENWEVERFFHPGIDSANAGGGLRAGSRDCDDDWKERLNRGETFQGVPTTIVALIQTKHQNVDLLFLKPLHSLVRGCSADDLEIFQRQRTSQCLLHRHVLVHQPNVRSRRHRLTT